MKKLIIVLGVLVALAAGVYTFRAPLLLAGIKFASQRAESVGEFREVEWAQGPDQRSSDKPNIVLILADDMGWNDMSLNGGGVAGGLVQTPNIDSIASSGVNFTNGYSGQGTCAPSRAMIMTGRYGSRFGFEYTPTPAGMLKTLWHISDRDDANPSVNHFDTARDIPSEEKGVPASEITIAEMLKEQGYYTAHIGKWHIGRTNGMAAKDQGFDQSLLMYSGLYGEEDDPDVVHAKLDYDPIDKFLWAATKFAASYNSGEPFKPDMYLTDYYTREAVKVIENNRNRPFFLYLAHWAPHTPLQAAKQDYDALSAIDDHTTRVYGGMMRGLDRGVGQVLQALKDNGLEDNTLVIFSSDNGGAAYVGIDDLNKPYRGWKITNFEGGIHVPFMMKWPARIPAGTSYQDMVHHFDIFATAAAAAGAELPSDRKMDGVDLLPFVRGDATDSPHQTLFWRAGNYRTVRHGNWKFALDKSQGKSWLFDLSVDPGERNNLADSRPELVADMRQLLEDHQAEMVPPSWDLQVETAVNVDKHYRQPDEDSDEYVLWGN